MPVVAETRQATLCTHAHNGVWLALPVRYLQAMSIKGGE